MIEDVVQHQYKTFITNENKVDAALSLLFFRIKRKLPTPRRYKKGREM